jgi:hypothetical protein
MKMEKSSKIILDLCGGTGAWSKPYRDAGYDVRLITLPDYDVMETEFGSDKRIYFKSENHEKEMYGINPADVYGILAAPPCTKFSKADWLHKKKERDFVEGMKCVRACMNIIWHIQEQGAPLKFWALENPMGYLYNFLGNPAYYFQPWWFGETNFTKTKREALWGYFNAPARTILKRNFPFISPHTSKRDTVEKLRENKEWYSSSAEDRAKTSSFFANAFFKANQ